MSDQRKEVSQQQYDKALDALRTLDPDPQKLIKAYNDACDYHRQRVIGQKELHSLYDALKLTIAALIDREAQNVNRVSEAQCAYEYHLAVIQHQYNEALNALRTLDPDPHKLIRAYKDACEYNLQVRVGRKELHNLYNALEATITALRDKERKNVYSVHDERIADAQCAYEYHLAAITYISELSDTNLTLMLSSSKRTLDEVLQGINQDTSTQFRKTLFTNLLKLDGGADLAKLCRDMNVYKLMDMADIPKEVKEACLNSIFDFPTIAGLDDILCKGQVGSSTATQFISHFSVFAAVVPGIRKQIKEFISQHSNFENNQEGHRSAPNLEDIHRLELSIIHTFIQQLPSFSDEEIIKILTSIAPAAMHDSSHSKAIEGLMAFIYRCNSYQDWYVGQPGIKLATAIQARVNQLGPEASVALIGNMTFEELRHNAPEFPLLATLLIRIKERHSSVAIEKEKTTSEQPVIEQVELQSSTGLGTVGSRFRILAAPANTDHAKEVGVVESETTAKTPDASSAEHVFDSSVPTLPNRSPSPSPFG
jgi:hypothetical protein